MNSEIFVCIAFIAHALLLFNFLYADAIRWEWCLWTNCRGKKNGKMKQFQKLPQIQKPSIGNVDFLLFEKKKKNNYDLDSFRSSLA